MPNPDDIKALMALVQKITGEGESSAPVAVSGDDDRITKLAEAVQTAVDGNIQLAKIVEELKKEVERFGAFTGAWNGMAAEKERDDGIEGLKSKYGSHAEYSPLAAAYAEAEGEDIWPILYDTLAQAKHEASQAEGSEPFNDDEFIGGKMKMMGEHMRKMAEAHGKLPKPATVDIAVETVKPVDELKVESSKDDIPDSETASRRGREAAERVLKRRENN